MSPVENPFPEFYKLPAGNHQECRKQHIDVGEIWHRPEGNSRSDDVRQIDDFGVRNTCRRPFPKKSGYFRVKPKIRCIDFSEKC